jgi:hypothetical protein
MVNSLQFLCRPLSLALRIFDIFKMPHAMDDIQHCIRVTKNESCNTSKSQMSYLLVHESFKPIKTAA